MKIFLIGYGKMGKMIESLAVQQGHSIVAMVDAGQAWPVFTATNLPDVAIEFTRPDAVVENLKRCISLGIPVVTGTTGWQQHKDSLQQFCIEQQGSVMYASNFSIGVNIWFRIIRYAAQRFASMADFETTLDETHHINKIDKPSGTAITAADILLEELKQYHGWSLEAEAGKLQVTAHREAEVTGIHSVLFRSAIDEIELIHRASGREGFARGAVLAAVWMQSHKGFYDFAEVFDEIFAQNNK